MEKFTRILLLALGGLLALAIILLLAVNLYVQSQATQARIQQELSHRLDTTLHIRRISVTPWGGLKLTGITIPQQNKRIATDFLEAKTFRLRIRFSSLFSQRLVIKEISLIKPNVVWVQNADGKWRLPAPAVAPAQRGRPGSEITPAPASPTPPAVAAQSPPLTPSTPVPAKQSAPVTGTRTAFIPEIRRVNLRDGAFHFLDEHGRPVATFTGVDFRSNFRNATALRGMITIAKTSLRNRFFLEKLKSPLQYDPTILDFSRISAHAAGGVITGRFSMRPQEQDSPFTARVQFHNLQADQLVMEAGGPKGMIKGRLEGMLEGAGQTADPNALTGHGEIFLRDGEVQQYSLLVALGQILQIEELTQLRLDEAHVKYHLTPGLITIDDLVLRSPNIRLSATGTITFSGKLRLESQLALNEKIRGQLFRAIRNNFQPTGEADFAAVAFQIRGTVGHPKTNLMDRLVGEDLKDLGSVLNSLFGGGKSERKKKKKQHAAEDATGQTPVAAPTASPALSPTAIPLPEASATP